YMVETVCGGVVIFDYDGDGDHDLFFVDGGALPGYVGEPPRSRLLRNDGDRFVDVTETAGVRVAVYGCGGAAGDTNADGHLDLLVTAFGSELLFENQGDGTFREIAAQAGLGDPSWSASAAFADTDRDGDLDLYVTEYVDFTIENHRVCRKGSGGVEAYCQPDAYRPLADRFFRNQGDGRFQEATAAAGLALARPGAGLGVVFTDADADGWPDLYVANDQDPNHLFVNLGDGTFEDRSLLSGTAVNERGEAEAGMGVDAADYDGDGRFDLVVTNFEGESNGLYRNLGGGLFLDARFAAGIAEPSVPMLAFGVDFADFDHDGDLDLVIANGHVHDNAAEIQPTSRYAQRNQLFENLGNGGFREVLDAGL
ncbi:MAG: VCBS repeat-containing protein, partial [Chloroflexi bacterium]|nr:VCBS repeat-containing protein [Chloroflexota bacterium]